MAHTSEFDPRPWYLLSPALVAITFLVVVPMAFMLVYSFYRNVDLGVDKVAFQYGNWKELFHDNYYHFAIWKTFRLSAIVTVLAAVLGYIPAYFIANTTFRHKWLLLLLLILPFWVSFIIRTLSWIHIMGNEGVINRLLMKLGIIQTPLPMMYNEFAVIVGFIHVFLPYMILNVYVSLEGIDRNLVPAARTLGCTPWQAFREVTLPLSLPGLAAGCLLVFVLDGGKLCDAADPRRPERLSVRQPDLRRHHLRAELADGRGPVLHAAGAAWPDRGDLQPLHGAEPDLQVSRLGGIMRAWRLIRIYSIAVYLFMFAPIAVVLLLAFNSSQFGGFPMTGFPCAGSTGCTRTRRSYGLSGPRCCSAFSPRRSPPRWVFSPRWRWCATASPARTGSPRS